MCFALTTSRLCLGAFSSPPGEPPLSPTIDCSAARLMDNTVHGVTATYLHRGPNIACESDERRFEEGDSSSSRRRLATLAWFLRCECVRLHVRHGSAGVVPRSRTVLCQPVPNPTRPIRTEAWVRGGCRGSLRLDGERRVGGSGTTQVITTLQGS